MLAEAVPLDEGCGDVGSRSCRLDRQRGRNNVGTEGSSHVYFPLVVSNWTWDVQTEGSWKTKRHAGKVGEPWSVCVTRPPSPSRCESPVRTQERGLRRREGEMDAGPWFDVDNHIARPNNRESLRQIRWRAGFPSCHEAQGPSFAPWESDHRSATRWWPFWMTDHAHERPMPRPLHHVEHRWWGL